MGGGGGGRGGRTGLIRLILCLGLHRAFKAHVAELGPLELMFIGFVLWFIGVYRVGGARAI